MKKIACILGSPRIGGNTETIANKVIAVAEEMGATTEIFRLNKLTYKGCQACLGCKKGAEKCVVKDELTLVLDAAMDADITIIASPVYFGQMTAQMKAVLDRMYSFLKPTYLTEPNASRLSPGKKCVFVFSQGSPDKNEFNMFPDNQKWFSFLGYDNCYMIRGVGMNDKSEAGKSDDLMKQAADIAKIVME
ncbi:MAG: flavodoxin family protein [Armatimonadota bacterium]